MLKNNLKSQNLLKKNFLLPKIKNGLSLPKKKFENNFLLQLEFENEISIKELLEKVLIQGGTEGFFATTILYQYYWNQQKLGQEIPVLDPQHVVNSVYGANAYKLNPSDKDRYCNMFMKLEGILIKKLNRKETERRRKNKTLKQDEFIYDHTHLITIKKSQVQINSKNGNQKKVQKLEGVKFLPELFSESMTTEDYKKISRAFIPSETILKLSSDKRKKAKSVFMTLVCQDLANLKQHERNEKDYDYETCIKYGQWTTDPQRKSENWGRIIKILNDAHENGLITYTVFYGGASKPVKLIPRNIEYIRIKRLFSVDPKYLAFNFVPEQLELPWPQSEITSEKSQF